MGTKDTTARPDPSDAWRRTGAWPRRVALELAARIVLGGVFVYYGGYKIVNPIEFLKALRAYDVLPISPPHLINVTAVALPWIEALCGVCLLLGRWLRPTAGLVLALLTVFTAAVACRAIYEQSATGAALCSIRFDCGCGQGPVLFCVKLAENTVLMVLALLIAFRPARSAPARADRRSPDSTC